MLCSKNYNFIIDENILNNSVILGNGYSGDVYYHKKNNKEYAIKIFNDYYLNLYKSKIEELENLYETFQKIKTNYILMPEYILYQNKNLSSIVSRYKESFPRDELLNMNINDFKNAISNLTYELTYLGSLKILASDITYDNLILNKNDLYICDVGEFKVEDYLLTKYIKSENINCLIEGFIELISYNMDIINTEYLRNEYLDTDYNFLNYFEKDSKGCILVGDYVKKKSKR